MKIATLGTGGIGGFLAVHLTDAGHQVAAIARGRHLEAIRKHGLVFEQPGRTLVARPWIATDDCAAVGEVDAVIVAVKGQALEAAARSCLPMVGSSTVVIPFLNGVEAAERLLRTLPADTVANGLAAISTTITAPGVIRQTGNFNQFLFAERDSRPSLRIDALRTAFDAAGAHAPPTDDITRDVWAKFVAFTALSGVTAAARCTVEDILRSPPLSMLFQAILEETATLARKLGVAIPDTLEAGIWESVQELPPSMRASTAIDLENGRPLETEWISGAVVRLAKPVDHPVPLNQAIYALLEPYRLGCNRAL